MKKAAFYIGFLLDYFSSAQKQTDLRDYSTEKKKYPQEKYNASACNLRKCQEKFCTTKIKF